MENELALDIKSVHKKYGPVEVLRGVDVKVKRGDIHALLGSNGAGKSTLVKIISGLVGADQAGYIKVWGADIANNVASGSQLGLGVLHQEVSYVDSMTVIENMCLPEPGRKTLYGRFSKKKELRAWEELIKEFNIEVDLQQMMGNVPVTVRSQLLIVRLICQMRISGAKQWMLILDEPSASLAAEGVLWLMRWLREAASSDGAVLLITHRFQEVFACANAVTVLRDGSVVWSGGIGEVDEDALVSYMLGDVSDTRRTLVGGNRKDMSKNIDEMESPTVLELDGVVAGRLQGVSLACGGAEVVGVTSLAGGGSEELFSVLSGEAIIASGKVLVNGYEIKPSIKTLLNHGVVVVPGDRSRDGLWMGGEVYVNLTIKDLQKLGKYGWLNRKRELTRAEALIKEYGINTVGSEALINTLSGGNQQKVMLARGFSGGGRCIVVFDPVQGVDIGVRREVRDMVQETAYRGVGIVMVTSDVEFLAECCDRIVILADGRVVDTMKEFTVKGDEIVARLLRS